MLDRVGPGNRPLGDKPIGYQSWRRLLFLHWEVELDSLRAVVPPPLELDLWDGRAYVGVVPLVMQDVRPGWWPKSCALNFLELNVRAYVHYRGRPGIYFFSLDANSLPAVWGARLGWGLPYYSAKMNTSPTALPGEQTTAATETWVGRHITFRSCRSAECQFDVRFEVGKPLEASAVGTLQHFFLERYLLFTARGPKGAEVVRAGQVHHAPYPAHEARVTHCTNKMFAAAGLTNPSEPPAFAHFSPGVDVDVYALRRSDKRD